VNATGNLFAYRFVLLNIANTYGWKSYSTPAFLRRGIGGGRFLRRDEFATR